MDFPAAEMEAAFGPMWSEGMKRRPWLARELLRVRQEELDGTAGVKTETNGGEMEVDGA